MDKELDSKDLQSAAVELQEQMVGLAAKLSDLNCENVRAYQISAQFSYTDYVIIATTLSDVQRKGILDTLPQFLEELNLDKYIQYCINRSQAANAGGWMLIDFKDFIIHLMNSELREFYALDSIFFEVPLLFQSE